MSTHHRPNATRICDDPECIHRRDFRVNGGQHYIEEHPGPVPNDSRFDYDIQPMTPPNAPTAAERDVDYWFLRNLAASVAIPSQATKARLEEIASALLAARRENETLTAQLTETERQRAWLEAELNRVTSMMGGAP